MDGAQRTEVDAGSLRYVERGSGSRPLLLLHTFRTQLEYHRAIAPAFEEDFRVYALDLPGHGESSRDPGLRYDATLFADAVRQFIEHHDLREVTVLGESIGGTIGLLLGASIPDRLAGVIACNVHDSGTLIGGWLGGIVSRLGGRSALVTGPEPRWLLRRARARGFRRIDPPSDFVELLAMTARQQPHFARATHSMHANGRSWTEAPKRYLQIPASLPVHLISGDHNWSRPPVRKERATLIVSADQGTVLPDTGHFSFLDNPAGVIEEVQRVLVR